MKRITALFVSLAIAVVGLTSLVACGGGNSGNGANGGGQGDDKADEIVGGHEENGDGEENTESGGNEQPTPEVHVKLTEEQFRAAIDATMKARNATTVHTMYGRYAASWSDESVQTFTVAYDRDNEVIHHYGWASAFESGDVFFVVRDGEFQCWHNFDGPWEISGVWEVESGEIMDILFFENDVNRCYWAECDFGAHYDEFVYDEESDSYTGTFGELVEETGEVGKVTLKFKDGKLTSLIRYGLDEDGASRDDADMVDKYEFGEFGTTVITLPDFS